MKKTFGFVVFLWLLVLGSTIVFAHSGGTDSKGGHYDHINGGYHYHHGYPAHQHPNGECPYRTESNETTSSNGHSFSYSFTMAFFFGPATGIGVGSLVFAVLPKRFFRRHTENSTLWLLPTFAFLGFLAIFLILYLL